jgi:hypothetical protein
VTTFVQFAPSPLANFQFQATFDGTSYSCTCTWNYYGQRYYISVATIQGAAVYTLPLIASPDDFDINLNSGYFSSTLVFRDSTQAFEISP